MRKKSKSAAILAVIMAMTLAGSSAVYAEENPSAKTTETDDNEKEDTRAAENESAPCNEGEHELIESKVVLPTCTERGYTIYKCKVDGCTYEEKRDETAALGHELKEVSMQEATADKPGVITYKCQRQGCDYTELAEIPVKNTNTVDGKQTMQIQRQMRRREQMPTANQKMAKQMLLKKIRILIQKMLP